MSCGVGRRHGSDSALPWLWRRPAATAPIRPLAWEPPYAAQRNSKKKKTKKKKKKKKKEHFSGEMKASDRKAGNKDKNRCRAGQVSEPCQRA